MMRNVYLEGELGEKYGKKLRIRADTIEQVFKCLDGNFSDFRSYLMECHSNDIGFTFYVGDAALTSEKELFLRFREGDMVITPQPIGAKSGFAKFLTVVAAIVIIAATAGAGAAAVPGTTAAGGAATGATGAATGATGAATGATGAAGGTAAGGFGAAAAKGLGIALASIGIQKLLMPDPATDTQQDSSYLFQGSSHNMVEGDPVPVLYGELRIPGRPVSAVARNTVGYFYNGVIHNVSPPSEGGAVNPGESCGGGGSTTPGTDPTAPEANADEYSCEYEQTITGNVLDNDVYAAGVKGTDWGVDSFTAPAHGTLNWVTNAQATFNGAFTYTATTLGEEGNTLDSFSYTIKDTSTGAIAGSEVTITYVEASQGTVTLGADSYNTTLDTALSGNVLDNDTHSVSGVTLTVVGNTSPAHGSLSISSSGAFTYTPNSNFSGLDSFFYTVEDGRGTTATSPEVIIAIGSGVPVAMDDQYETDINSTLQGNVLTNDRHTQQGVDFSVDTTATTGPSHGTLTLDANGSFTYTPTTDFTGEDSFIYTIVDDNDKRRSASVRIGVLSDSPTAVADSFIVPHNTTITRNVLSNDLARSGGTIAVLGSVADPGPSKGTLTTPAINDQGFFTYTPNTGESGQDSFTYAIYDPDTSLTSSATVTLTLLTAAPVATDDSYDVQHNTALTVTNLLDNDSSPSSLSFTVTSNTNPSNGTLTSAVSSTGGFTYTPTNGYSGSDQFNYTITDSAGQSTSATVFLTIAENTVAPVATDDSYAVQHNTALTVTNLLDNDSSPSSLSFTVTSNTNPSNGTLTSAVSSTGGFTYTPTNGYSGSDQFNYTVTDSAGQSTTGTVFLTIAPEPNVAPVAVHNQINNQTFGTNVTGRVRQYVTDANAGDVLRVIGVRTAPTKGTLTLDTTSATSSLSHGSWQYTPTPAFAGTDYFEVDVTDETLTIVARTTITYSEDPDSGSEENVDSETLPGQPDEDDDNPLDFPKDDSDGFTGGI